MGSMAFHLLPIFAFLCVVLVGGGNASVPAEEYWRSKLPNTPMPKQLQDLLQPADNMEGKNGFWDMGFNQSSVGYYGMNYGKVFADILDERGSNYARSYEKSVADLLDSGLLSYHEKQQHRRNSLPNSTVYFLYKDFHVGKKMKLHLTKSTNEARFLTHRVAESTPFSSDKLPEILQQLSIKPGTLQAKIIEIAVKDCEESPGTKGVSRYCSRSLESMIDFTVSQIGNKAQLFYNEIEKPTARPEEYSITGIEKVGENQVLCHKRKYPYAVYYCHSIDATKVYRVKLVGADGSKAKAVGICHTDTENWRSDHLAFLILKIKPGQGTICHFIKTDALVWTNL